MDNKNPNNSAVTDQEALDLHQFPTPGKIEMVPSKKLTTARDLSLAYSPGVAVPCLHIHKNPEKAYDYTAKGNMVAVISNGTAVLGLGNLGALASKPVMEGKSVLFKRFADVNSIDLEVSTENVDEFVNCVRYLGASFGGINLEDIKAPDCFYIEQQLQEMLDIPVFHDDQHGTAIIVLAGLLNALDVTKQDIGKVKVVMNGAGSASIACADLMVSAGLKKENLIICDSKGVIHQGRLEGMNPWKEKFANKTDKRTLAEALDGANVFMGLSVKGAVTQEMVKTMAKRPIVFAMANPDPEITPEDVKAVRPDAITATGRSDYPNQINNVLGFPYIFRGALDVRASKINEEMKIAAAEAIAGLARKHVPDEVRNAYAGRKLQYGPEYLIPVPFDPRLISHVPVAVAKAAVKSGVARTAMPNERDYKQQLSARLDPTVTSMQAIFQSVQENPKRVIFAEGEEEKTIRAAIGFKQAGYGEPILIESDAGRIQDSATALGLDISGLEVRRAASWPQAPKYADDLYKRLQRKGHLLRDCHRRIQRQRNVFGAAMLQHGDADAMVTGLTRNYTNTYNEVSWVLQPKPNCEVFAMLMMVSRGKTVFISDTAIHDLPDAKTLASIAKQSAGAARNMGFTPRVALLSFSNFGNPMRPHADRIREAVQELDQQKVDFEYDGEMTADVALNKDLLKLYPFCRLSDTANVLIMPALHTAHVSSKLLQSLGGGTIIGPLLMGLEESVQIVQMSASVSDIVTAASFAAYRV